MSRESGSTLPYLPGLDGLRGVAVAAVLVFHADLEWASGGHLGVSTFFTLSGFLITSLLLLERDATGRISLGGFWARRARRLVPAMLLCFGLIAVVLAVLDEALPSGLIGDAVASSTWVANWRFIVDDRAYGDLFASPSPFQHFWSLAVEEQFYVAFPLVVAGISTVRSGRQRRWALGALLVCLVAASTVQLAVLHDGGDAVARAYYGTDARVAEILVGALLAVVLVTPSGLRQLTGALRSGVGAFGLIGSAGLAWAYAALGDRDPVLYRGGFLAVALCSAAVIAAASDDSSLVGRALSAEPLVWLGKISYGTYLFHWPIFIFLDEDTTELSGLNLFAVRAVVTLVVAGLSYALVESPIRHGRWHPRLAQLGWVNGAVAGVALIALASGQLASADPQEVAADQGGAVGVTAPGAAPAGTPGGAPAGPGSDGGQGGTTAPGGNAGTGAPQATQPPAPQPSGAQVPAGFAENPDDAPVRRAPEVPPGALRVAVVGDSIGDNLARGLQIWAAEHGDIVVYNATVPGCPLSRGGERRFGDEDPIEVSPVCGWWDGTFAHDRFDAFADFAPDVVVLQDGVNEMLDRRLDHWDDFRRPGDPRFDTWLRQEYEQAVGFWADAYDSAIVVTNAPCADWDRYEKFEEIEDAEVRIQALNTSVYPQMLGARQADLFQRVCPGGRYSNEVEGVQNGRPDGFHFSDEAAAALARNWLGPIVLEVSRTTPGAPPPPTTATTLVPDA